MKSMLTRMTFLTALAAVAVMAQGPRPFHDGGGPGLGGDPATGIARRVAYLKALLTLTDAQATQATTIYTNAAAAVAPLQTTLSTARQSLRDAVKANSVANIDQLAAQIGTATGQILAAESKAEAAFYALLTADQRTRFDAVGGGRGGRGPRSFDNDR